MTIVEEILLKEIRYIASISNGQVKRVAECALASVSEYLATEQSGERVELIADLRRIAAQGMADYASTGYLNSNAIRKAADMLEADAQQAKRVPMTAEQITEMATQEQFLLVCDGLEELTQIVRSTEQHHDITPADKPADWSAA